MEKFKVMHEDIKNIESAEITKKSNISIVAIIVIIAGIVSGMGAMYFEDPNSAMPSLLITLSAIFIIGGIIKLVISHTVYIYKPTKSLLKLKTIYFPNNSCDELQNCLSSNRFDEISSIKQEKNHGLKLEVLVSKDKQFIAVQILQYIPYNFEPISPITCYFNDNAQKLVTALKINKF